MPWVPLLLASCVSTRATDHGHVHDPRPESTRAVLDVPEKERATPPPTLPDVPDLRSYLAYGFEHSSSLRASFENWQGALARVDQAGTLPDPRFTYGEFLEEVQTRTGPQERRFSLSQSFPWPGSLSRQESAAGHQAASLRHEVEAQRLRVALEIEESYLEYAFLGTHRRITRTILELLRGLEPVVQSRIQSGGNQEDLLRLQVEIGKRENDLASLEKLRPSLSSRLAAALSHPGRLLLPVPSLEEPAAFTELDIEELHRRARNLNPRLKVLQAELRQKEDVRALAGIQRRPSFTVGVDYIQTGSAVSPSTRGSGDDPVAASLSMSLPLWRKSYRAAEREAEHSLTATREKLVDMEARLHADVELEAFRVDDAARQISLYRESLIPRARETLELTTASYRSGKASLLDLIDAERSQLEFELAYWRACRDYRQNLARLSASVGGTLP